MWTERQRRRLVDVIHDRWWQSHEAPIPEHHIGKDLSVCKRLIEGGQDPDELAEILDQYDGGPATLLVFYKRGNRHIWEELRGAWRKSNWQGKSAMQSISAILKEIAS